MMKRSLFHFLPSTTESLPAYRVRQSSRARHVHLTISPSNELIVVVPRNFDERLIPRLIQEQRHWIERKLSRSGHAVTANENWKIPPHVELPAIDERWLLNCHENRSAAVRIVEDSRGALRATGAIADRCALQAALRRWLKRRAKQWLPQRLAELAAQAEFNYARVTIRHQRSRWGSCSSRGTISLNAKLMLVIPELVDHVLLHELCHTIHPNHGADFHQLLADLLPNHRQQRVALRDAWATMPRWTHD